GLPPQVFYLAGLVPWAYFSTTVTTISMSLVCNADMLTKIYFPRILLPASSALGNVFDFMIGTVILVLMAVLYGVPLSAKMALWPLLVLPLFLLALTIQLWLFATPIIYPVSMVPDVYRPLLVLNPLSGLVDAFRYTLNPGAELDVRLLLASLVAVVAVFTFAVVFFRRQERVFADYV